MSFLFAILLALATFARQNGSLKLSPPSIITPVNIDQSPLYPRPTTQPIPTDSGEWGIAVKTGEHTYQIKVNNDAQMGTPAQILNAINDLRIRNGAQPLKTNEKICAYAQSRAEYFTKIRQVDEHKGFKEFLENDDGFEKLGFGSLGENSSYGYIMSGVHLIEFVYMRSPEHNKNQLDPKWDHGCVGVSESATNIIFATSPL